MTDLSQQDTQALVQRRSDLEYALQGMMVERVPFVDDAERELAAINEELARRNE